MIQLKGFTRLMIKVGETKRVVFTLDYDDFTIINKEMKRILEKVTIEIMIGTSSDNFVLKGSLTF
jgi:beta-glucosidase